MSELLKSYDNAAGRTAQVRYDTPRLPTSKKEASISHVMPLDGEAVT